MSSWTVVGNVGDVAEGASTPTHAAGLSAGNNSQGDAISQRFFTNPGQIYTLDFDSVITGTPDSGSTLKVQVQVIGGSTNLDQTITPPVPGNFSPTAAQFQHYHYVFTADASVTTLSFTNIGLGNGTSDELIDSVVVAAGAATVTLNNADFEAGPFGQPATVTGWTVGGSNHVSDNAEGATSGTHGAALSAGVDSSGDTLSQTFSTAAGVMYTVDFDAGISGKRTAGPLQLTVQVLGTGTLLNQTVTPPDANTFTPSAVTFQHYHLTFTADGGTATIRFISVGSGNGAADQVVDTVAIAPIIN